MFCPPVSRLAHQVAIETQHVVADVVDVEALPELAERHGITSVPKTTVNGSVELLGSQSASSLIDAIETALLEGKL